MILRYAYFITSAIFLFVGLAIFFGSSFQITGFAISEISEFDLNVIVGTWFILAGLILFFIGRSVGHEK